MLSVSWVLVGKWFVRRGAYQLKECLQNKLLQESQTRQLASQNDNAVRQELAESKRQLMAKLDTLFTTVSGTVQTTQDTVTAVQQVAESVRQAVNIRHHIRQYPWYFVGGAAFLGYVARKMFTSPRVVTQNCETQPMTSPPNHENQLLSNHSQFNSPDETIHPIPIQSTLWSELRAFGRNSVIRSIQEITTSMIQQMLNPLIRSKRVNINPQNSDSITHGAVTEQSRTTE